ncbi:hypothetical protein [Terasakiella sp.]|uniref:hypothetical protein n=1 Tax=Terasakiella sp. TaxID=2034861 RepID=UPI003AA89DEC
MDTVLLDQLDPKSLLNLARAYEEFAKKARSRAAEIELREQRLIDINHKLKSLHGIGPEMAELLNQCEYVYAQKKMAKHYKTPPETIDHYWKKYLRRRDAAAIDRRKRLIASLARRGLTNRQIAQRTGMHEVSICRILKPILRP